MTTLIPSEDLPSGLAALTRVFDGATAVRAAVAFVTSNGVALLAEILAEHPETEVEIVARGAPITERDALVRLGDELGAEVSIVMGEPARHFHPKLWIGVGASMTVLSGSGNLTRGGLIGNDEQFELYDVAMPSAAADRQLDRLARLVALATPLDEARASVAWREWEWQDKRRRALADEVRRMDEALAHAATTVREADKQQLLDDLHDVYARTVDADIPRADGQPYRPTRFLQGLRRAAEAADPVPFVTRVCRKQTPGFDVILEAGRRDLTLEALVADESKPYHDLFSDETRRLARERLGRFPHGA